MVSSGSTSSVADDKKAAARISLVHGLGTAGAGAGAARSKEHQDVHTVSSSDLAGSSRRSDAAGWSPPSHPAPAELIRKRDLSIILRRARKVRDYMSRMRWLTICRLHGRDRLVGPMGDDLLKSRVISLPSSPLCFFLKSTTGFGVRVCRGYRGGGGMTVNFPAEPA